MVTSKKVKGRSTAMPVGVIWGVVTAVCITFLLVTVVTWLILTNKTAADRIGYYIMGILVSSSFIGAMVSGYKIKRRWLLVSIIVGIAYYVALSIMTALVFGGHFRGIGVTAAMIMIGCVSSGAISIKLNEHTGKRTKKYRAG